MEWNNVLQGLIHPDSPLKIIGVGVGGWCFQYVSTLLVGGGQTMWSHVINCIMLTEYFGPKGELIKITPAIKKPTYHKTPLLYSLS